MPKVGLQMFLITACFFMSGMAGLIYQVAWARYLALFLGHTSYAVVAVLVAFMGGLALGNAWLGRRADTTRSPLKLYGWLEIAIGIYGVLFPFYYQFCYDWFIILGRNVEVGSPLLLVLKFLFSLLLVLLPTTLMGATLPVLTRFVTSSLDTLRERVAWLYFINSLGAVMGCIVGDFWWIPKWGLEVTVYGAAMINIVAGIVCLVIDRKNDLMPIAAAGISNETSERYTPRELRFAVVGIGISGFVAMLYEVAWTRLLALSLGSSSHAFSIMLITFIAGIATGSAIVARWKKLKNTLEAFAWAEIALGVTVLVSMFFYEPMPFVFAKASLTLAKTPDAYVLYQLVQATVCFMVMFIPATILGTTLPFVSRIATSEIQKTGKSIGGVFAVNTVGTVLGAGMTGLLLLPWLGLARTFAIGAALNILVGYFILRMRSNQLSIGRIAIPIAVSLAVVLGAGAFFSGKWVRANSFSLWRSSSLPSYEQFRKQAEERQIVYHEDGAGSSVTVIEYPSGEGKARSLLVNGKADAGTTGDMGTQLLLAHIPLFLKPNSEDILVIGLGSGVTCGAALGHPQVKSVEVVEISPEVVEAAEAFSEFNHNALKNPRLKVHIEDAKSFLNLTPRLYDVVISEPSNPWMAGVASVFTHEYYVQCANALKTNGIMVQWLQYYEFDDAAMEMVIRTFGQTFPIISIWHTASGDLMLVGSKEVREESLENVLQAMKHPQVQEDLKRIRMDNPFLFLMHEIVSQYNGLFIALQNGPIHTDLNPTLEYVAQKAFVLKSSAMNWYWYSENLQPRSETLLGKWLKTNQLSREDFQAFSRYVVDAKVLDDRIGRSVASEWQKRFPDSAEALAFPQQFGSFQSPAVAEALRLRQSHATILEEGKTSPQLLRYYRGVLMQSYRNAKSIFHSPSTDQLMEALNRLIELDADNRAVYLLNQAEIAWDQGDDERSLRLAEEAFAPKPGADQVSRFSTDPNAPYIVLKNMIQSLWAKRDLRGALEVALQAEKQGYLKGSSVAQLQLKLWVNKIFVISEARLVNSTLPRL